MYAGYVREPYEEVVQYFQTDNWFRFHDMEGTPFSEETLQRWALWLNSPWSYSTEKYRIERNLSLKDNYTPAENFEQYPWRCYFEVVGYDCACAAVYGYGETPEEALMHCIAHEKHIQYTYNPKNISV